MVLLTITPKILYALELLKGYSTDIDIPNEPSLDDPALGRPISHTQVIGISKSLKKCRDSLSRQNGDIRFHLDDLLRGSKIYIEPPKPKKEQVEPYLD